MTKYRKKHRKTHRKRTGKRFKKKVARTIRQLSEKKMGTAFNDGCRLNVNTSTLPWGTGIAPNLNILYPVSVPIAEGPGQNQRIGKNVFLRYITLRLSFYNTNDNYCNGRIGVLIFKERKKGNYQNIVANEFFNSVGATGAGCPAGKNKVPFKKGISKIMWRDFKVTRENVADKNGYDWVKIYTKKFKVMKNVNYTQNLPDMPLWFVYPYFYNNGNYCGYVGEGMKFDLSVTATYNDI